MNESHQLVFWVNGKKIVDNQVNPEWTLLTYLRNKVGLCGTKLGCAEGGCGACTVMVSRFDRKKKKIINLAVNACLTPVCSVHGAAVITVEGIGSIEKGLHPVQERIAKSHGSQCGFCTPGIVMSMYALLRNCPIPTMEQVETAFQGNLCRCTGYRPILEGYKTLTKEGQSPAAVNGGGCCGNKINGGCCMQNGNGNGASNGFYKENVELYSASEFKPYDPTKEIIFPPELQLTDEFEKTDVSFIGQSVNWFRPCKLETLLDIKTKHPNAKIIMGNTEVGVEVKFKNMLYPTIIHPHLIPELTEVSVESSGVRFGSAVTLSEMEEFLQHQINSLPKWKTRVFSAIVEMLRWFAGKQIRNTAAIGGNIMTASPISDLNPLFMAANAKLLLKSKEEERTVNLDETFFTGYRRTVVRGDEIFVSILIPYTSENEFFWGFKQAKRRDDDIAIVNAGMSVAFYPSTNVIEKISLSFGGMAATTIMAQGTISKLTGKKWEPEIIEEACQSLMKDLPLDPSAPGGMIHFRRSLTLSFFFKFYLIVSEELSQKLSFIEKPKKEELSVTKLYHRDAPESFQFAQIVPEGQANYDLVGRPVTHLSAEKQATGEAIYVDDMPKYENELYLALVTSTKAHAEILEVNPSKALEIEGVIQFISAKDIESKNNWFGTVVYDERVFAEDKVTCYGQVIGAIIAVNQATAQKAAKLVQINYKEIIPAIITIKDAIEHKSFFEEPKVLARGNVEQGFEESEQVFEGEMHLGGQEHFYLETHACIAVPKEDKEMEIFCSTQNPNEAQLLVSHVLEIPQNKIVVRTKRLGGGFGGKESRFSLVLLPVAIAALRTGKPVRCMLDRDQDMEISGTRHPFYCKYKVGFNKNGKILSLKLTMYSNGGNSLDLTGAVMERALFSADNAYNIPNMSFTGYICKTNLPSNTAFRGFGGPQGMMFCENVINQVADKLNVEPASVREMNFYKEGDLTHYNQQLKYCTLQRCWDECFSTSLYSQKRMEVDAFNKINRWKKRGLAIIPTKFGIAFTALFLNQSGALIMVYRDGSVLLSHGGTEMGQGLHTKMIQVASRSLKISASKIHIMETSTDKVPNTSPTAASAGSDLNGMAVMNACQKILERLEPYMRSNAKGKWEDWVNSAYFDRVCLSATGFYKTPGIGFNWEKQEGDPFNYFCFGAACSEVEIDCLTGDHEVRKTDLIMDVGESLNPAIDIGQVEGAYMQGYGLFTLEQHQYSPNGHLWTKGPGMYKLPGFGDIPQKFNVSLLRGAPNPKAVFSSKAVGEPPLFLAAAVFYAIKDAIKSARNDYGLNGPFNLNSPATAERIRLACEDQFTSKFEMPAEGTYKPWAVIP